MDFKWVSFQQMVICQRCLSGGAGKKGTGARVPRGRGASSGHGGELPEETGCAETKTGGGKSVLYLGNS